MNVKKRISIITALMMLLTVFAIPSLAYGETVKKSVASQSGYYIGDYYGDPYNTLNLSVDDWDELYLYDESGEKLDPLPENWYWESSDTDIATINTDGRVSTQSRGKAEIYVKDGAGVVQATATVYVGNGYRIQLIDGNLDKNPYDEDADPYTVVDLNGSINLYIDNLFSDADEDQSQWSWSAYSIDGNDSGEVTIEDYIVDGEQKGITITGDTRGIVRVEAEAEFEDEEDYVYAYADGIELYIGDACRYYAVNADNESMRGFLNVGDSQQLKVVSVPKTTVDQSQWGWNFWAEEEDIISIAENTVTAEKESEDNWASCYAYNLENDDISSSYYLRIAYVWDYQNGFEYKIYPKAKTAKIAGVEYLEDEEENASTVTTATIPASITIKDTEYAPDGVYAVDSIDKNAFLSCKWLKNVNVPNSIKEIGQYAMGYYYNDDLERYEKYPDFTITGYSATSAAAKYAKENGITYINLGKKANQTISGAASFKKAYGSKAFSLGAKTNGNGKLTYKSSNTKVAAVSAAGKVTIKGTGTATITITAAATSEYNAAAKKVTITINPKKVTGLKTKAGKKQMTVSWKKDTKATGYQLTYAQNKKFTKGKKNVTISKNKTVKKTVKKLKSKKTYYVKVRAYKKVGSKKLYGSYSAVKSVKIK
ncbi:fibronectin type III domain-containing protein [bacterium 210820-DFI.6.37]|nr:fibronectin type III domain-containing protein [bacterium 210820-DFI.6.37]